MPRPAALLAALAFVAAAGGLGACGDDGDDVGSTPATLAPDAPGEVQTYEGTIEQVTPFEPITEDCTPPEDLDPDGVSSSDDPPVCTDPATAPVGSILLDDQIVFSVGSDVPITGADGSTITFADLAVGTHVVVGFDGQIAESFPGQAQASTIEVRGG